MAHNVYVVVEDYTDGRTSDVRRVFDDEEHAERFAEEHDGIYRVERQTLYHAYVPKNA